MTHFDYRSLIKLIRLKEAIFLSLLLFCSSFISQAETFLPFSSASQFQKNPVSSIKMLNKKDGWVQSHNNILNGSFSAEHYWIKVKPENLIHNGILVIENAHIDTLDVYIYDRQQHLLLQYHSGDLVPFINRYVPYHYFNFYLPKETTTILLHARSKGSLLHPLKIIAAEDPTYFLNDNSINLIFLGVLMLALVINLMFSAFLKDSIYLYYSLYLIGIGINYANDLELTFQFFWPNHPEVNQFNAMIYSLTALTFFFGEKFLQLKTNSKGLYRTFLVLYALMIANGILSLFSYSSAILGITVLLVVGPVLMIVAATIIFVRKKEIQTLIFLLAWSVYMLIFILYSLAVASVIPYFSGQEKLLIIGTTLEIVMLMVAVVYKFNVIREEGMKTKERLIKALYENEKILSDQNIILEERIKERTNELEEKNEKLKLQSNLLEDQNKIIESSNRLLKDNQAYLEQLVQERTEELTKTNTELLRKNDRLEQFSFVAAHNIRGPLSTLLGLSNLYNLEKTKNTDVDSDFYLQRMRESGEKLDAVVKSLGLILDLENNQSDKKENIVLKDFINDILSNNEMYMRENAVSVKIDFSLAPEVWSNATLLSSVFTELFTNSVKFRRTAELPLVSITSKKVGDKIVIEYIDNSQGMDIKDENAFQPFRKVNESDSGKGIGLYLVRRQVEFLGGTIDLESKHGEGCRYKVSLPIKG